MYAIGILGRSTVLMQFNTLLNNCPYDSGMC